MVPAATLLGDINRFPLPDVIQFLVQVRAKGALQVRRGSRRSFLLLWDGQIVEAGGGSPEAVLMDMLSMHRGRFFFRDLSAAGELPPSSSTPLDAQSALFDALCKLDEQTRNVG